MYIAGSETIAHTQLIVAPENANTTISLDNYVE